MISNDKMFYHYKNGQNPITLDIFLTNFCNNDCKYCTYKRWALENGGRYYMRFREFTTYVSRRISLGVRGVILTGGGEPTINPDFDLITNWLEKNHIHYGINTNFNVFRKFSPDYLKISLDGYDRKSYADERGADKFETVRENIYRYDAFRKRANKQTSLGVQKVVSDIDTVKRYYRANADLPVDYIVFRPVESTMGEFYQDRANRSQVRAICEAVKELKRNDNRVQLNYKFDALSAGEHRCRGQWSQLAIDERGNVMYCCHKPYEIVGHIMDEDILEKKRKFNTDLSKCDIPCRLTGPNYSIAKIEDEPKERWFI